MRLFPYGVFFYVLHWVDPKLWLIISVAPAKTFALCLESAENEFNMPGVNTHILHLVPKHSPWPHQDCGLMVSVSLGIAWGTLEKDPSPRPNFSKMINCLLVATTYQNISWGTYNHYKSTLTRFQILREQSFRHLSVRDKFACTKLGHFSLGLGDKDKAFWTQMKYPG